MPILSTMGLKKIYVAEALADGTMPGNGDAWLDLGDVYQETCTLKDSDPETTTHKSETSKKKITNNCTFYNVRLINVGLTMLELSDAIGCQRLTAAVGIKNHPVTKLVNDALQAESIKE